MLCKSTDENIWEIIGNRQSNKMNISGTTEVFGCIAHPTDHVRAPQLFNQAFQEQGLDKIMVPVDITPEGLDAAINGLRNLPNFKGAAVTIPHKLELAKLCDELGEGAQIAGAVNAISFTSDRRLIGDNFDGKGFVQGLIGENPLRLSSPQDAIKEKKIIIVGAGGAARAIALSLSHAQPGALDVTNRTAQRADEVVSLLKHISPNAPASVCVLNEVRWHEYDMVINATSLGLHAHDPLPIPVKDLNADCLVCDIIMKPQETQLLQEAAQAGLTTHYGRHMLDYQMNLIARFIGAY